MSSRPRLDAFNINLSRLHPSIPLSTTPPPSYKFLRDQLPPAMQSELEQALALLIKAVSCYIFVLALREFLRILEPFLDLTSLQQWHQDNRRQAGRPPQPPQPSPS